MCSIMSAYIKRGSKLTVHLANQGSEHEYQVFIKTGSPPTETDYDYQMTRCDILVSFVLEAGGGERCVTVGALDCW